MTKQKLLDISLDIEMMNTIKGLVLSKKYIKSQIENLSDGTIQKKEMYIHGQKVDEVSNQELKVILQLIKARISDLLCKKREDENG